MKFRCIHCNINVTNLNESIEFYKKALNMQVVREKEASDGSFKLVYLNDGQSDFEIELTWLKDHPQAYELGENESHICFENTAMGLYFIHDPDDYWLEIIPSKK